MKASVTGGAANRLEVEKIPTGMQLCTFYLLADLGTQETNFGEKHQIQIGFEFPLQKRVFIEGGDEKPCALFKDLTLSLHEKASLRKNWIEPMHRKMTDDEAADFEIESLLGKHFVATIVHTADGKYANISSITPLTDQTRLMFGLSATDVVPVYNPIAYFEIKHGFESENFKSLPRFIREKAKKSTEGEKHKASGGVFAEPESNGSSNNQRSAPSPSGSAAPSSNGKLIMLPTAEFTLEQYIAAGWTEQQIIDSGFAKRDVPVEAPKPMSAPSPAGPPTPSAPAPSPAPPQAEPVLGKHQLKDPDGRLFSLNNVDADIKEWIAQGWTLETLAQNGHGNFQQEQK